MFLSQRNGTYYLWYNDDAGRRRKVSTKTKSKTEALRFIRGWGNGSSKPPQKPISQFVEEYHRYSKTIHAQSTADSYLGVYRMFIQHIGDIDIGDVTTKHIDTFLSHKITTVSPATARRCRSALSSLFKTAKRWRCIDHDPVRESHKPRLSERMPLYLNQKEIKRLVSVIDDHDFGDVVLVALLTGLRSSEIRNLTWKQIDFRRKVIHVQNTSQYTTKSKRDRSIPMHRKLVSILKKRNKNAQYSLVFHNQGRLLRHWNLSIPFKRYVKKARLNPDLTLHSLRHSFASMLVDNGASLYVVQKLLGHSDVSSTQIYSHLSDAGLRDGINRFPWDSLP
jgi:site-specific recombinase XerD